MLKDNFATLEVARIMLKLGFNEECFGMYVNDNLQIRLKATNSKLSKYKPNKLDKANVEYVAAPIISQVIEFFSKKYGYDISILKYEEGYDWYVISNNYTEEELLGTEYFPSIKKALEKGVKQVLHDAKLYDQLK